jgi:hypothetical protein
MDGDNMEKSILERFGFKYNKRSVHTGRTIMLEELSNLLEAVPDAIVYDDYIKAIIDQNRLLKRSSSSRTITAKFCKQNSPGFIQTFYSCAIPGRGRRKSRLW